MIRPAEVADLPAVVALLAEAELSSIGVAEHFGSFFVADQGGRIVATAGFEVHGHSALVRSVAVARDARGAGLGAAVLRRALVEAHQRASAVYALTTTAERYLARFGFQPVQRLTAPAALLASRQFQDACPASATLMRRIGL